MLKSPKSNADGTTSASAKAAKQALTERDRERQITAQRTAQLRELRLARDKANAEIAEKAAGEKAAAKSRKRAPRRPAAHRNPF